MTIVERAMDAWERGAGAMDAWSRAGELRWRVRSLFRGMKQHHAGRAASAMAFELCLASIPMLAVVGWVLGQVLRDTGALLQASMLLDLTPSQVGRVVTLQLGRFSGPTAVAPFALVGSWWLAAGAFHRVMNVFELALAAKQRHWWVKRLIGLGCVVVWLVALAAAASIVVVLAGGPGKMVEVIDPDAPAALKARMWWFRWATLAVMGSTVTLLTGFFFRIAVRRPGVRRRVWPGALLTVMLGGGVSMGFTFYAKRLASFTVFYGSLAAVAIVLAWLWLLCAALLLGAELNAQLEGVERKTLPPSERV